MSNGEQDREADFTKEEASAEASSGGLETIPTQPYDPEPEREGIRGKLAIYLLMLLIGVVTISFVTLWIDEDNFENLKSLLELIYAPIIALVGTVTGFYFGGKTKP